MSKGIPSPIWELRKNILRQDEVSINQKILQISLKNLMFHVEQFGNKLKISC